MAIKADLIHNYFSNPGIPKQALTEPSKIDIGLTLDYSGRFDLSRIAS